MEQQHLERLTALWHRLSDDNRGKLRLIFQTSYRALAGIDGSARIRISSILPLELEMERLLEGEKP